MIQCQQCMMRVTADGMCRCSMGSGQWPPAPGLPFNVAGQGWICPRCDRVNAPWMPCCLCSDKK